MIIKLNLPNGPLQAYADVMSAKRGETYTKEDLILWLVTTLRAEVVSTLREAEHEVVRIKPASDIISGLDDITGEEDVT